MTYEKINQYYLSQDYVKRAYSNMVLNGATQGDFIVGANFYKDYHYYSKNHIGDGVDEDYKEQLGFNNAIPEFLTGDFSIIGLKNRFQMSLIFGPTGSGKTARVLQNMALQDLMASNFEYDNQYVTQMGQLIIDPKADFALAMKYAGEELESIKRTQYLVSVQVFLQKIKNSKVKSQENHQFIVDFLHHNLPNYQLGANYSVEDLNYIFQDWKTYPLFQLTSALHLLLESSFIETKHVERIKGINPSNNRAIMNVFDPLMDDSPYFNPMRGEETTVVASITKTLMSMSGFSDPNSNPHFYNASKRALEYALKMIKRTYENFGNLQDVYNVLFNIDGRKVLNSFKKRNNKGIFNKATTEENNSIIRFFDQEYFYIQENMNSGKDIAKNNAYTDSTGARDSIEKFLSNPYLQRILNPDPSEENVIDLDDLLMYGDKLAVGLEGGSMGDTNVSNALGQLIVLQFQDSVLRRPLSGRLPFIFVVDEFQQYASPEIKELLNQGRSYKVASHFATQSSDVIENQGSTGKQILSNITANTRNKIYLTGTQAHKEAKELSDNFGFTSFKTLSQSLSEKDGKKGGATIEVIDSIGGKKTSASFSIKEFNDVPIVPPSVFQGGPYSYERTNNMIYPSKKLNDRLREIYPLEAQKVDQYKQFSLRNGGGPNFVEGLILLSTATEQETQLNLTTSTIWSPYWILDYQKTQDYVDTYQLTHRFYYTNKTEPDTKSEEQLLDEKIQKLKANQSILPKAYHEEEALNKLISEYERKLQANIVESRKPVSEDLPSIIKYYTENLPTLQDWGTVVKEAQAIQNGQQQDFSQETLNFIHNHSILKESQALLDSIDINTVVKGTLTERLYYSLNKQILLNPSLEDRHLNTQVSQNMVEWFYGLNEIVHSSPGDVITLGQEEYKLTKEDIVSLVEVDEENILEDDVAKQNIQEELEQPNIEDFEEQIESDFFEEEVDEELASLIDLF